MYLPESAISTFCDSTPRNPRSTHRHTHTGRHDKYWASTKMSSLKNSCLSLTKGQMRGKPCMLNCLPVPLSDSFFCKSIQPVCISDSLPFSVCLSDFSYRIIKIHIEILPLQFFLFWTHLLCSVAAFTDFCNYPGKYTDIIIWKGWQKTKKMIVY